MALVVLDIAALWWVLGLTAGPALSTYLGGSLAVTGVGLLVLGASAQLKSIGYAGAVMALVAPVIAGAAWAHASIETWLWAVRGPPWPACCPASRPRTGYPGLPGRGG